jgi:hypothetical protein
MLTVLRHVFGLKAKCKKIKLNNSNYQKQLFFYTPFFLYALLGLNLSCIY